MLCRADEVNFLSGPGKGVILIKLGDEDRVLGFIASTGDRDLLTVETTPRRRADHQHRPSTRSPAAAAKGASCCSAASSRAIVWPTPEAPPPLTSS